MGDTFSAPNDAVVDDMLTEELKLRTSFFSSQPVTSIATTQTRIILPEQQGIRKADNVFECTNEHVDAKLLFSCLAAALHDGCIHPKKYAKSKLRSISLAVVEFVPWLNDHIIDCSNRATIVKDFETFRVNDCKVKPQSSQAAGLLNALGIGLAVKGFKDKLLQLEVAYIRNIIDKTKLSKNSEPDQNTLTSYFSQMQWIREYMDNDLFNRVASPKALMTSFSITVATLMLEAQRLLDELELYCIEHKITTDMLCIEQTTNKKDTHQRALLLHLVNTFCKDYNDKSLRCIKVMLFDISTPLAYLDNLRRLKSGEQLTVRVFRKTYNTVNANLALFTYDTVLAVAQRAEKKQLGAIDIPPVSVTALEEKCFIWLMAWQAVQPSDIAKLKRTDFRLMERSNGSITHVSCEYYKGRAHDYKETPMLAARDVEGEAVLSFIQRKGLNIDANTALVSMPNLCNLQRCGPSTLINQMFDLAAFPVIHTKILLELGKRKAAPALLDSINTMMSHGIVMSRSWKKSAGLEDTSRESFRAEVNNSLPGEWFGLEAIKNSSVHSRSDNYRIGHLVNYNSHENETERSSYLTSENPEWLNNCGRVTRSVMNDLAINVLSPSSDLVFNGDFTQALEVINDKKNDVLSRLKLVTNTTGKVNELGIIANYVSDEDDYPDTIYLLDTPETYVQMKHYLAEGLKHYKQLLVGNPIFLEYTVLPTCEWIDVLFNTSNLKQPNGRGFSEKTVKEGDIMYKTFRNHLPPLFAAQLKG
jgi:hypothetical protein